MLCSFIVNPIIWLKKLQKEQMHEKIQGCRHSFTASITIVCAGEENVRECPLLTETQQLSVKLYGIKMDWTEILSISSSAQIRSFMALNHSISVKCSEFNEIFHPSITRNECTDSFRNENYNGVEYCKYAADDHRVGDLGQYTSQEVRGDGKDVIYLKGDLSLSPTMSFNTRCALLPADKGVDLRWFWYRILNIRWRFICNLYIYWMTVK